MLYVYPAAKLAGVFSLLRTSLKRGLLVTEAIGAIDAFFSKHQSTTADQSLLGWHDGSLAALRYSSVQILQIACEFAENR